MNRVPTNDCPFVLKDANARTGVQAAEEDRDTEGVHGRDSWVTDSNGTAFLKQVTAGLSRPTRSLLPSREANRGRCAVLPVVARTRNVSTTSSHDRSTAGLFEMTPSTCNRLTRWTQITISCTLSCHSLADSHVAETGESRSGANP